MKFLIFFSLILMTITSCTKDNTEEKRTVNLSYPSKYSISHYDIDPDSKSFILNQDDSYSEIETSANFLNEFDETYSWMIPYALDHPEVVSFTFLNDSEVELYFFEKDDDGNIFWDTTAIVSYTLVENKVSFPIGAKPMFFDESGENLLWPLRTALFEFIGNINGDSSPRESLDKNYQVEAENFLNSFDLNPQDTFAINFLDLVYKKE